MADKMTCRTFPTAFKLAAIKRLKAGEAVLPLARELGTYAYRMLGAFQDAEDALQDVLPPVPPVRQRRPVAVDAVDPGRLGLEEDGSARRQAGRDQVLHHLLLAVDHDVAPAQLLEVDPPALPAEVEAEPAVD